MPPAPTWWCMSGRALSSFYQCGALYSSTHRRCAVRPGRVERLLPRRSVSAHARSTDPANCCSSITPSMRPTCTAACRRSGQAHPLPAGTLPGPRLRTTWPYTQHFMILNDFPLFWDASLLPRACTSRACTTCPRASPGARPHRRTAVSDTIRWFEADPTYVLHFVNAWRRRRGGAERLSQRNPMPPPLANARVPTPC